MRIFELTRIYEKKAGEWGRRSTPTPVNVDAIVALDRLPHGTRILTAGGPIEVSATVEELLEMIGAKPVPVGARAAPPALSLAPTGTEGGV